MVERSEPTGWSTSLLVPIAFAISYAQYALFYHTQNQYFFHGLAKAGFGLLRDDWFARTPDPWPVFTTMVEFTYRHLGLSTFYLYFLVLLGLYAFCMVGIVSRLIRIDSSRAKFLVFVVLMTALHSPLFGYVTRMAVRLPMTSSPHHFNVGRILLLEGIGEKRILGDMLNPATFGVFFLLSMYLFMYGKPFWAVAASTVATVFQPSYVLYAGILTLSYLFVTARRTGGLKPALALGLYALVLMLPLMIYSYVAFRPTDPAIWKESENILWRIAYYPPSVPALWLGAAAYIKIALVLAAMYLVRRTEFFWLLLLSFLATVGLTVAQMITNSNAITALLPWRISAFLVPLATLILLGYAVSHVVDRLESNRRAGRILTAASVVVMMALVVVGVLETRSRFAQGSEAKTPNAMRYARTNRAAGQTYLIPPNWRGFRLFTGVPAFAEASVIPYNDVGVMEWYKRIRLAQAFYGTVEANPEDDFRYQRTARRSGRAPQPASSSPAAQPSTEDRCHMLKELSTTYAVTHVILKGGDVDRCEGWKTVLDDGAYRVYSVVK